MTTLSGTLLEILNETEAAWVLASDEQGPNEDETGFAFTGDATLSDPTNWGQAGTKTARGFVGFGPNLPPAGMIRVPRVLNQREVIIATIAPNGSLSPLLNVSSAGADGSEVVSLELGRQFVDQLLLYATQICTTVLHNTSGFGYVSLEIEGFGHQLKLQPNVDTGVFNFVWGDHVRTATIQCTARNGTGTGLVFRGGESNDANGGPVSFSSGLSADGFAQAPVGFGFNEPGHADTWLLELAAPVIDQRVVALAVGRPVTSTDLPEGTGDRVLYLAECGAEPECPAVGGVLLWFNGSQLKAWFPGAESPVVVAGAS